MADHGITLWASNDEDAMKVGQTYTLTIKVTPPFFGEIPPAGILTAWNLESQQLEFAAGTSEGVEVDNKALGERRFWLADFQMLVSPDDREKVVQLQITPHEQQGSIIVVVFAGKVVYRYLAVKFFGDGHFAIRPTTILGDYGDRGRRPGRHHLR